MRLVLLGTGTGVGKTFVGAALRRALATQGQRVVAIKPIESGFGDPLASDAHALEPGARPLYTFPDAVSPHLAARRAGVEIELAKVVSFVHERATHAGAEIVIIETAGGALTPLSDLTTNVDLARALEPATLVLVAPDALGVLHDLRATTLALRSLLREPDFVVLSRSRPADASTGTNAGELARIGLEPCAVVGENPDFELQPLVTRLLELARRRAQTHGL